MGKKTKQLSQAEIWDDSALVDSWNEAYEEYKHYHSLHARGEKVKNVLDAYERGEGVNSHDPEDGRASVQESPAVQFEDGEIDEGGSLQNTDQPTPPASKEIAATDVPGTMTKDAQSIHPDLTVPSTVIASSTQDPTLKSLMMSWYWAGYYTGLHEGQRQTAAQSQQTELTTNGT